MLYFTHKLLNEEQINEISNGVLSSRDWVDGKVSSMGNQVKKNLQLHAKGEHYDKFSNKIINIVEQDMTVQTAVFPAKIHNILFTRTGGGMFYGTHYDTPHIPSGRRDLSFTIFLNEKKDYEGGELILYIPPEKKTIKLNPGEMIIYPTKYLHEVKEVTQGERMVCVGWIESLIPNHEDRESLHLFKSATKALENKLGDQPVIQSLNISFNNIFKRLMT